MTPQLYEVRVTGAVRLFAQPKVHNHSSAMQLYLGLCMLYANIARVALYSEGANTDPVLLRCTSAANC